MLTLKSKNPHKMACPTILHSISNLLQPLQWMKFGKIYVKFVNLGHTCLQSGRVEG